MAEPTIGGSLPAVGTSPIPLYESRPQSLLFYWVQLHELERLMHIERPFSLALASAATGYALGVLPLLRDAYRAINDLSKTSPDELFWHGVYCMTFALAVGISIITWGNAFKGKSDATKLLEEIKRRPRNPVSAAPL